MRRACENFRRLRAATGRQEGLHGDAAHQKTPQQKIAYTPSKPTSLCGGMPHSKSPTTVVGLNLLLELKDAPDPIQVSEPNYAPVFAVMSG